MQGLMRADLRTKLTLQFFCCLTHIIVNIKMILFVGMYLIYIIVRIFFFKIVYKRNLNLKYRKNNGSRAFME